MTPSSQNYQSLQKRKAYFIPLCCAGKLSIRQCAEILEMAPVNVWKLKQKYLEKAIEAKAIQVKLPVEDVVTDIRMLVIGNAFEWAMTNGSADFEGNITRSISHYLDGELL